MQEALLALNEAVRIAQQHNDNVALAHALPALCQVLATAAPAAVTQLTEAGTAAAHPSGHLSQLLKILKRYESVACKLSLVTWAGNGEEGGEGWFEIPVGGGGGPGQQVAAHTAIFWSSVGLLRAICLCSLDANAKCHLLCASWVARTFGMDDVD